MWIALAFPQLARCPRWPAAACAWKNTLPAPLCCGTAARELTACPCWHCWQDKGDRGWHGMGRAGRAAEHSKWRKKTKNHNKTLGRGAAGPGGIWKKLDHLALVKVRAHCSQQPAFPRYVVQESTDLVNGDRSSGSFPMSAQSQQCTHCLISL